jgi:hypothetical protein
MAHVKLPHTGTRGNPTNKTLKLNTCMATAEYEPKKLPAAVAVGVYEPNGKANLYT